jgi:hypothetical protein
MQHYNAKVKGEFWTVHGIKAYKDKYTQYHSKWKQRRASKWKNPFEVPDTPTTVLKEVVVGNGKTADGEMKIDFRFTKAALERYDELNRSDVTNTCKGREANLKLLDLFSLDIQMLLSCDAMAVKGQKEISEESADTLGLVPGGSVLTGGTQDGDASDGSSPAASDGGPPAPAAQPAAAANPDYRYWQPYLPLNVKWAHLGLTEPNASELDHFFPACAFFFYIDEVAKAHPAVNNALHQAWQSKFKKPMNAEDLDNPPDNFTDEASAWYRATIQYMQDKLTNVQRGLRSIPLKERRCRTKASAQAKKKASERQG